MLDIVGKMAGKCEMDRSIVYVSKWWRPTCGDSERLYFQFHHLQPTHTQRGSLSNRQRLIGSVKHKGRCDFPEQRMSGASVPLRGLLEDIAILYTESYVCPMY